MSESGSKKAGKGRVQGWEEAGGEFYQESYVSDWDKPTNPDTSVITTLLPSKQSRFGTTKHNTKGNNGRKIRKASYFQTTTTTTMATTATAQTTNLGTRRNEMQFAVLPDLSQVLTDEERIWEEMLQIKLMPVSMQQKKSLKSSLQSVTKLRLQGFQQFKWKHRKAWTKIGIKWTELWSKLKLWQTSLKQIEGQFGTGVMAYFMLIRWLFFLNCITFSLIFCFVILPNLIVLQYKPSHPNFFHTKNMQEHDYNLINCENGTICSFFKTTEITALEEDDAEETTTVITETRATTTFATNEAEITQRIFQVAKLLEIVQNSDILHNSLMFYGAYSNEIIGYASSSSNNDSNQNNNSNSNNNNNNDGQLYYDLPLAYVLVNVFCFLLILIAIVVAAAREFNERLINGKHNFYQYCNLVFGGWDFCIYNEKSANIKHKALLNEIKCMIQSKHLEFERNNRTKNYIYKLFLKRFCINFLVIIILIISAYLIYLLINLSLHQQMEDILEEFNELTEDVQNLLKFKSHIEKTMHILIEYLPYMAIVFLNLFLPTIFNYMIKFEKYTPIFQLKVSVFRTIFIRFASLALLLSRFYYIVIPHKEADNSCWETFVGHQFYKLVITDFLSHIIVTLFINYPRAFCARYFHHVNFIRIMGEQEFELPKHVLDIVYTQTICWLGSFYSPFLPACMALLTFGMFYIKKVQCLVNSKPSQILYGISRAKSLFMLILLLSFVLAVSPIAYALSDIRPSTTCGPFRGLNSVWDAAIIAFMTLPAYLRNFIFFFGTAYFAVPAFFILVILLYYYWAVSDANKHMVKVLKNQLILEGHDKQFLLNRLSYFIKHYQDAQEQLNVVVVATPASEQQHLK